MLILMILTTYLPINIVHTVKGELSDIKDFPHAVFLSIECYKLNNHDFFTCGASILNQGLLLSAAHCLDGCLATSDIVAYTGNEQKRKGIKTQVSNFVVHEHFDRNEFGNDIAMLRLEDDLRFGEKLKRVAVMRRPPYSDTAELACWGRRNANGNVSDWLQHTTQVIMSHEACEEVLGESRIPRGAFCAKEQLEDSYLGKGGSGSALIIKNFIQIGILSYNMPKRSKNIAVYTDIVYFYHWIVKNSKKVFCNENNRQS